MANNPIPLRREQIEPVINLFLHLLTQDHAQYYAANYTNIPAPTFIAQYGSKNAKIVKCDYDNKPSSVYCFIDLSNGDILKAAGWKAPAKGARGNIFNEDCDVGKGKPCTVYGSGLYR